MKLRSLLVTIGLVIAVAILVLQRAQISKLTAELQSAKQQVEQPAAAETPAPASQPTNTLTAEQSAELLRLRAQVTALQRQTNEITKLQAENARMRGALASAMKAAPAANESEPPLTEERRQAMARLTDSKTYALALLMHAEDNQQRFATNLDQVAAYLAKGEHSSPTGTNIFDVVFQGSRESVTNPGSIILVREHQAHQSSAGNWTKTYGFLDGHSEIHSEPTGNFDAYEQQHSSPPPQ